MRANISKLIFTIPHRQSASAHPHTQPDSQKHRGRQPAVLFQYNQRQQQQPCTQRTSVVGHRRSTVPSSRDHYWVRGLSVPTTDPSVRRPPCNPRGSTNTRSTEVRRSVLQSEQQQPYVTRQSPPVSALPDPSTLFQ